MLFNSVSFAIFLPIVFALYWSLSKWGMKFQNVLLLIASYFFYACWDYRFLFLLIFSTLLDYYTGLKMAGSKTQGTKKFWFLTSIIINVGFLGVFKYYNFFASSFAEAASHLGFHVNVWSLQVILPVGISFYTFHGLSYVIDIYKDRIKPERDFVDYSVFVCFFPLLVAGPIERATHLLPQIKVKRKFDYGIAVDGIKQILWGLFKKIVIADNCARFVNIVFKDPSAFTGSALLMGAFYFTIQIYCDFSGYSDIAIGTARLFGIDLLRNFAFPYFSRDIAEFWRRWHISLTTWFRDYLYIPLGGSKGGLWMKVRNTFIIFLVSGFWHGANWTFIVWGGLNALYFMPLLLLNKNRSNIEIVAKGKYLPSVREFMNMSVTFGLTILAWVFFRSDTVGHALGYISRIFSRSLFSMPHTVGEGKIIWLILLFLGIEWLGRERQYAIAGIGSTWPRVARWSFYYLIIIFIVVWSGAEQPFIYFQF